MSIVARRADRRQKSKSHTTNVYAWLRPKKEMMLAFVTVGSTRFDELIDTVLSTAVLTALRERGYRKLVVQCGNYSSDLGVQAAGQWQKRLQDVDIILWRYKPTLMDEIATADLVISHAGTCCCPSFAGVD